MSQNDPKITKISNFRQLISQPKKSQNSPILIVIPNLGRVIRKQTGNAPVGASLTVKNKVFKYAMRPYCEKFIKFTKFKNARMDTRKTGKPLLS